MSMTDSSTSTTEPTEVIATQDPSARVGGQRVQLVGLNVKAGPVRHIVEERQALRTRTWRHFTVKPMSATIGAELHGVDITSDLSDDVVAEIRSALHAFKVIFFRDQPLSADRHVAFARRFGQLEIHPFIPGNDTVPELVRFAKSSDVAGYENTWHHDVTWREVPSMGAVLHAVQVPDCGGDTLFADMCAAYDGLDDETKDFIDDKVAVHDFMSSFGRQLPPDRRDEFRAKYPIVEHPVVCTHTSTGRKYLYVNRIFVSHIKGLSAEDSAALIDRLCREADYPEYQCRFHWTNDAVAFWDNRAVQHYAASDYWPEVRIMERASIIGDRPVRVR